jgi:hypothetical protein
VERRGIRFSFAQKDKQYGYYKAKMGCVNTRTSQALQSMLEIHQPDIWIFGHYHVAREFQTLKYETKFVCVPELGTYDLDTENPLG